MKKVLLLIMAIFLVSALTACSKNYTNINNLELETMLENKEDYQFVDVRTNTEFTTKHIPGFDIVIDYYILKEDSSIIDLYSLDKSKPLIIMCNSGNRSVSAAKIFYTDGFIEIYNLKDGIQGWDGETE
jgi:rhodanese-related sulfurtransferase